MKKAAILLAAAWLLTVPASTARADENPCVEHNIVHALLFPLDALLYLVTLPAALVGGKPYVRPCEHGPCCHK